MIETLPSWVHAWRNGFVPQLSIGALRALRKALVEDDPRLLQGATCCPPPLQCVADWSVEGACPVGYMGAMVMGGIAQLSRNNYDDEGKIRRQDTGPYATVAEVEEYFAKACHECDLLIGEPAGCRWLLNWVDETPREQMREKLLPEVEMALGNLIRAHEGGEVHRAPPIGTGMFPCCGKTPFEVPETDRMTNDPLLVSCGLPKEVDYAR